MKNKSKDTIPKPIAKAWDRKLWLAVQRSMHRPTVQTTEDEMSILFYAILKRKDANIKRTFNCDAVWINIDNTELTKWRIGMAAWGWGSEETIPWSDEIGSIVLRTGIRIFALKPDGPLPRVFIQGANTRKTHLLSILSKFDKDPAWIKLGFDKLNTEHRIEQLKHVNYDDLLRYGEGPLRWKMAAEELTWKNQQVNRVARWLTKRGTIPPSLIQAWLNAWNTEF